MEDADFSDEFCEFIQNVVPAVHAAELLLLLHDHPEAWWDPADAVARLRSGGLAEGEGLRYLDLFKARGLLATRPDKRVQYRPAHSQVASLVDKLAQAYAERPVTLIRVIYALRDTRVRSFAEAFKLRGNR